MAYLTYTFWIVGHIPLVSSSLHLPKTCSPHFLLEISFSRCCLVVVSHFSLWCSACHFSQCGDWPCVQATYIAFTLQSCAYLFKSIILPCFQLDWVVISLCCSDVCTHLYFMPWRFHWMHFHTVDWVTGRACNCRNHFQQSEILFCGVGGLV